VKLWDIRACRLFKEFSDHTDPVTAVEFNPNEFLLASSSCDRILYFGYFENFRLVSTNYQNVGAIRCINFSHGGECLYEGSQDVLKLYGWEPANTYDTHSEGMGHKQDIARAQNQLICGCIKLTNILQCTVYPQESTGIWWRT
jgi:katanin p80 WD40 repeat-containing subunit B1